MKLTDHIIRVKTTNKNRNELLSAIGAGFLLAIMVIVVFILAMNSL